MRRRLFEPRVLLVVMATRFATAQGNTDAPSPALRESGEMILFDLTMHAYNATLYTH